MPRNYSENGPKIVCRKAVKPGTWSHTTEARLTLKPDGSYWISASASKPDDPAVTWVAKVSDLAMGQKVFDAMVDGFWFNDLLGADFIATKNWDGLVYGA